MMGRAQQLGHSTWCTEGPNDKPLPQGQTINLVMTHLGPMGDFGLTVSPSSKNQYEGTAFFFFLSENGKSSSKVI